MKAFAVARSQKSLSFLLLFSLVFGQFLVLPVTAISTVPVNTEPQTPILAGKRKQEKGLTVLLSSLIGRRNKRFVLKDIQAGSGPFCNRKTQPFITSAFTKKTVAIVWFAPSVLGLRLCLVP